MGERGDQGKLGVPTRQFIFERDEFEARKKKIVGRLLLDGGTVEEPSRPPLVLNVPPSPRRRSKK